MSVKFIPNGDSAFWQMADGFVRQIEYEPALYRVSIEDAGAIVSAMRAFADRLRVVQSGAKSALATAEKEAARTVLEAMIRRIANAVRLDPTINVITKNALGLRDRAKPSKALTVPNEPPRLSFVRAIHEASSFPQHELKFASKDRKPRAVGATRLELFVDLIAPDESVPTTPGMNVSSRLFYVRSYTRSPIRLTPPLASEPMRVVYWGRWADAAGNVGPFSATAVGWIEGGTNHLMPLTFRDSDRPKIIDVSRPLVDDARQTRVIVAVMETSTHTGQPALGSADRPQYALEGPASDPDRDEVKHPDRDAA